MPNYDSKTLTSSTEYLIQWNLSSGKSTRVNIGNKMCVWMEYNASIRSMILRLLIMDKNFIANFPGVIKIEYTVTIGDLQNNPIRGGFFVTNSIPFNGGVAVGKLNDQLSSKLKIFSKITLKLTKPANLEKLAFLENKISKCDKNLFAHLKWNDPMFCDFKILVDSQEFKVHKIILTEASGFFKAMFEKLYADDELKQMTTYFCTNNDFSSVHFEAMLNFIYTKQVVPPVEGEYGPNFYFKLYKIASFYEVKELENICLYNIEKKYRQLVTINAPTTLSAYIQARECGLKEMVEDFWFLIKFAVLRIFDDLENEPLPPEDINQILDNQRNDSEFWKKYAKK